MKLSRRQALALAAGGAAVGAGCARLERLASPRSFSARPRDGQARDWTLLQKFGFGPLPHEPAEGMDRRKWLEDQLRAPTGDDGLLALKLRRLDIHHFTAFELRDIPPARIQDQLQTAALLRAVESPWQLRERMADFWLNHFNINARKGLAAYRLPRSEKEVIRAHALGSFPEMARACAKSSAMLLYLDQQNSTRTQPNENFARELLELHTLGVDGGYSQRDVMEAARCFTGWSEQRGFLQAKGDFLFIPALHDDGPKEVLGESIPGGLGVRAGERVVEIAARHPSTARHIARKLTRHLIGSEEPEAWRPVEAAYLKTDGSIPAMIRAAFQAFEDGQDRPAMKRPFDFVVSALRSVDAKMDGGEGIIAALKEMGQPLYQWPMPDGYPEGAEAWTGSLLARWNFAYRLGSDQVSGAAVGVRELARQTGIAPQTAVLGGKSRLASGGIDVSAMEPAQLLALAWMSPEFQWR
jgi:uncharacterized protein (DUF1800 family)